MSRVFLELIRTLASSQRLFGYKETRRQVRYQRVLRDRQYPASSHRFCITGRARLWEMFTVVFGISKGPAGRSSSILKPVCQAIKLR